MAKSQVRFSWTYNHEDGTVTVIDKLTEESDTYNIADLPDAIKARITVYGIGKVLQDRASQVSADGKFGYWSALWKQLTGGQWKSERSFGGPRMVSPVIEVIASKLGCSIPKAQEAWSKADDAKREAIKSKYAEEIAEVAASREEQDEVSLDELV